MKDDPFSAGTRQKALEYLREILPDADVTDRPDSAGPLLEFVERGLVRIGDPHIHTSSTLVIPGTKWVEDPDTRAAVEAACRLIDIEA